MIEDGTLRTIPLIDDVGLFQQPRRFVRNNFGSRSGPALELCAFQQRREPRYCLFSTPAGLNLAAMRSLSLVLHGISFSLGTFAEIV